MDLIIKIFSFLPDCDRRNFSFTCKYLRNVHYNFVGYDYLVFKPPKEVKKFSPLPHTKTRKTKVKSFEIPFIYQFGKPPYEGFSIGFVISFFFALQFIY